MKAWLSAASLLVLAGCLDFTSGERRFCLQRLDVCGLQAGPHLQEGLRFSATPTFSQLPLPQRGQGTPGVEPGARVEFVYEPNEDLLGWRSSFPAEWSLQLCGRRDGEDLGCTPMEGEVGALSLPEWEAPLGRGGAYVLATLQGGDRRLLGYLVPNDGRLLIAELTTDEAGGEFSHSADVAVVSWPGAGEGLVVGYTVHGPSGGTLVYGTGPRGARTESGTFGAGLQGEYPGAFPLLEELLDGELHLRVSGSQIAGQLVPLGAWALHAEPHGGGLIPPETTPSLAAVTVIFHPASGESRWLVHKYDPQTTLSFGVGSLGLSENVTPVPASGQVTLPTLAEAFTRRRVFVSAADVSAKEGRMQLLAPGERMYGAEVSDGLFPVGAPPDGAAQVVLRAGSDRFLFDVWTELSFNGTAVLSDGAGTEYASVQGNKLYAGGGSAAGLRGALDTGSGEVTVSGGAGLPFSGELRAIP